MAGGRSGANGQGQEARKKTSPVVQSVVVLGALYCALKDGWAWHYVPLEYAEQARIGFMAVAGFCVLQLVLAALRFRLRFRKALDAERPKESTHSARIATVEDIEESGICVEQGWFARLFGSVKNKVVFYAGVVGRKVLLLEAVHMLIIAPSGAGKNRNLVFIFLGLIDEPCVVTDVKRENYDVTSAYRAWRFGQRVIRLGVGGSEAYNPLDLIKDGLAAGGGDVLTDARTIALALVPEPKDERNSYWRQGGRDVITIAMIGLCVKDPDIASLSAVQAIVTDLNMFLALCEAVEYETALEGDLAIMARGMMGMVNDKKPGGLQEYINVAKQAMMPYAKSGILHKLTEKSTFRYRDLKYKDAQGRHLTIYNHFDSSRRVVFEPFGAMLNACMLLELQRDPCPQRVVFINDEAANFVVKDLPKQMTIVRGDGNVHVINVCQSRAQMRATWGAEGEQMILDNSDLKMFFGISTDEEAKKVSELCGTQNILSSSYSLGHAASDGVGENRSIAQRPVLTPEMVRREKRAIVLYRQERVMLVSLPGYERCEPMRSKYAANKRYGSKRFKGPKEVVF
jgi:type IV secretion system protein VirD4